MDYIQFFTLFGTMLAGFAFIYKEFKYAQEDIKTDLKSFEREIREDIKIQSGRSDQLYTMFIDLLNRRNQRTDP